MALRATASDSAARRLSVGVGVDGDQDARAAVRRALGVAYAMLPKDPDLVLLFGSTTHDLPVLLGAARVFTGSVPLIGCTSSDGLMSSAGVIGMAGRHTAVAAMALCGAGLVAGVGHASLDGEARHAGEAAAQAATASALPAGRALRAVLVLSPPAHEEGILSGVSGVVGRQVPVFGITAADREVDGKWAVFSGNHLLPNSVAVALLYGDFRAGSAFSGGYWPTARVAQASCVSGRMVERLGGRPAAVQYAEWLGVAPESLRGKGVRPRAAASPVAVEDSRTSRLLIKEPGTVSADGSMGFFADIRDGDSVRLLTSTPESLVAAAGAAASEAMMRAGLQPQEVRGVLMAHGAGRALALKERLDEVPLQVRRVLGTAPMAGCASFGEQSVLADGRPVHLNLTATVLVLGG